MRFWIGARGSDMKGEARGIAAATAGDADSPLASGSLALAGDAVTAPSPTWLAHHPRQEVVYAALEKQGRVGAFRRTGETTLTPLGETVATGDATCHVSVAPDGSRLIATSWGEGIVTQIALAADGRLGAAVQGDPSEDPYASGAKPAADAAALVAEDGGIADLRSLIDRGADASQLAAMLAGSTPAPAIGADAGLDEIMAILGQSQNPYDDPAVRDILRGASAGEAANPLAGAVDLSGKAPEAPAERVPRAHCSVFLPDGLVATTDLGYDLVRFWRSGPRGIRLDHEVALPLGTGPRHMSLHPSGHLHVVTEHSCEVYVLRAGADGRWALRSGIAVSRGSMPGDTAAELTRSRDGEFLYAGLRGSDTIAVLRVRGEGDRLEPVALADSGIRTPRHHVVIRDALLVAGQGSHEIASLTLDQRTGIPGRVRHRLATPSPQHILPAR